MPRYEVTIRELPDDNEGCAVFLIIIVIVGLCFFGDSAEDKVDYWNGDKNCPIFIKRDDGSMVVFRKDSAQEVDKSYPNDDKLIIFQGYEIDAGGSYRAYGYGFLYNETDKFYEMFYPQTLNFPNGERFTIKNDYQINVCKVMIRAASKNDKYDL